MKCPRCEQEILDPDPAFCPKCGSVIEKPSSPPQPRVRDEPTSAASPDEGRTRTPANDYSIGRKYYLYSLLAVVGGVVSYRAVKSRNPRVAATILTISLVVSLIYLGAGFEVYAHIAGSPGTYGMTVTSVEFPTSSSIVVTVVNQGTLEDGLESVAINNGSIWFVYGLLQPTGTIASSEIQSGNLTFGLYGYILANGTSVPVSTGGTGSVGTEAFTPSHVETIKIPYQWIPLVPYEVYITTASQHPNGMTVAAPA